MSSRGRWSGWGPWLGGFCLLVALATAGCRGSKEVPEAGAVLLHFELAADAPAPSELRLSVWDDDGALWQDARVPAEGALPAPSHGALGTFLVQPGPAKGALRLHAVGLAGGVRVVEGILTIATSDKSRGTFDWLLGTAALDDADGDGVPDAIDDCPGKANASQGGCPLPEPNVDGAVVADASEDGAPAGADADQRDVPGTDGPARDVEVRDGGADELPPQDLSERDVSVDERGDVNAPDANGSDSNARDVSAPLDAAGDLSSPRDAAAEAGPACGFVGGCNLVLGGKCQDDAQCQSGFCADGVCCNSACSGTCRSCNLPGKEGSCQGYVAGTDPERECTGGLLCNGAGACGNTSPPGAKGLGDICAKANECGSGFCKDGVCCNNACTGACQSCSTGTCKSVTKGQDLPECVSPMRCNPVGRCTAD